MGDYLVRGQERICSSRFARLLVMRLYVCFAMLASLSDPSLVSVHERIEFVMKTDPELQRG